MARAWRGLEAFLAWDGAGVARACPVPSRAAAGGDGRGSVHLFLRGTGPGPPLVASASASALVGVLAGWLPVTVSVTGSAALVFARELPRGAEEIDYLNQPQPPCPPGPARIQIPGRGGRYAPTHLHPPLARAVGAGRNDRARVAHAFYTMGLKECACQTRATMFPPGAAVEHLRGAGDDSRRCIPGLVLNARTSTEFEEMIPWISVARDATGTPVMCLLLFPPVPVQ
eukprot:gene11513-biopygen12417